MVRRLFLPALLAGLLVALSAGTALGAIHPIVSSECASASASDVANNQDPVGQTPTGSQLDQSDLRALIATGVLVTDADGNIIGFDPTVKALNGNSGATVCPNA